MVCPSKEKRKKALRKAFIVVMVASMLVVYTAIPAVTAEQEESKKVTQTSSVTLNEFLPDPDTDWNDDGSVDEFIEIYNNGSHSVDISGWYLDDEANGGADPFQIPSGTTIPAGNYLVFYDNETDVSLNNGGDSVRLLNENQTVLDNQTYPSSSSGISYARYPDGYGNWATTPDPTPGSANNVTNDPPEITDLTMSPLRPDLGEEITLSCDVQDDGVTSLSVSLHLTYKAKNGSSQETTEQFNEEGEGVYNCSLGSYSEETLLRFYIEADDGENVDYYPEGAKSGGENLSAVVSDVSPPVCINELLPAPSSDWDSDGNATRYDEWMELYNERDWWVDISGLKLDDVVGDSGANPYQIPVGTVMKANGHKVYYSSDVGLGLNNGGDNASLTYEDGSIIDQVTYGELDSDVSYGRSPNGGSNWYEFSDPTPGSSNPDLGPQELNESVRSLLVTEVYYRETIDMDFVVLHNPSDKTVPLSFFKVSDQEGSWTFPIGAKISSQESIYLAFNGQQFEERMFFKPDWEVKGTLSGVPDMQGSGFNLAEGGDEVILKAFDGSVIDVVAYGDSTYHDTGWENGPAPGVSTGEILTRNLKPKEGYVDTNTSDDWVHPFVKGIGQSDFQPKEFEFQGKAECFVSPDCSFPAVTDFLDSAEDKIYLNVYMITNWYITEEIIDALDRGVDVKVFLEGGPVGGISDQEKYNLMKLANAGAKIRYMINDPEQDIYSRYRFNHAKYCVADNSSVLVISENWKYTGVPVNNTYGNRGWGIILHDDSLASYYADVFLTDYDPSMSDSIPYDADDPEYGDPPGNFTPDKEKRTDGFEPSEDIKTVEGNIKAAPVIGPDTTNAKEHSIAPAIKGADENLDIIQLSCDLHWAKDASAYIDWSLPSETQYLEWSDGREHHNLYLKEAVKAARRGVDVDVLLDSVYIDRYDNTTYDNYDVVTYLNKLAEKENIPLEAKLADHETLGIEKVHAKGLIVDNETVLISSINWGAYAAIYNREVGILVTNQDIAGYYADVFHYDWTLGKEEHKDNWTDGDENGGDSNGGGRNDFKNETLDSPSVHTYPEVVVSIGNAVIVVLSLAMATAFIWDRFREEER